MIGEGADEGRWRRMKSRRPDSWDNLKGKKKKLGARREELNQGGFEQ